MPWILDNFRLACVCTVKLATNGALELGETCANMQPVLLALSCTTQASIDLLLALVVRELCILCFYPFLTHNAVPHTFRFRCNAQIHDNHRQHHLLD